MKGPRVKFRMRYVAGGALVLGIAAGVWLGDWFKGFGPGGTGTGFGTSNSDGVLTSVGEGTADLGVATDQPVSAVVTPPLRVVIRDRSYFLRDGDQETPIDLLALVATVARHPADEDGIKLRIYRANSARAKTVQDLVDAVHTAGITDAAIYTSPDAVE
jgi:hypothetical protein